MSFRGTSRWILSVSVVILHLFVVVLFPPGYFVSLCSCFASLCSFLIDFPMSNVNSHFKQRLGGGLLEAERGPLLAAVFHG